MLDRSQLSANIAKSAELTSISPQVSFALKNTKAEKIVPLPI